MPIIPVEVNDRLREFAESEASQRGCADAGVFLRSLLEDAAELAELRKKLQVAEDEIARGECVDWHPGDGVKMFHEILERRKREGKTCPSE